MTPKFEVLFLEQAIQFMESLKQVEQEKIYYNMDKARYGLHIQLFKKLKDDIWEFRTRHNGVQYRLMAFWDKRDKQRTLVVATHGVVKKVNKIPFQEIKKAKMIRSIYFSDSN